MDSAEDVGKAVAENTPDVDLTQNPQQLGEQAGDAIKDAGKEVAKQSPINFITMLDLPSPQVSSSQSHPEATHLHPADSYDVTVGTNVPLVFN